MAAPPRITIKSLDYFKYRKLIVDGNREDYNACDKDVRSVCDDVQTIHFRDEEFDDATDRARLADVFSFYRRLVSSRRVDATDVKIKSGWWGDQKNAYSAGKIKSQSLKVNLVEKSQHWLTRQGFFSGEEGATATPPETIDGPGIYVFRHKDHQCFQEVCKADNIFMSCSEKLRAAFEGTAFDPLGALLVTSMSSDWDFYYVPINVEGNEDILRIFENDVVLKHDSIWPRGLNFQLHLHNLVEISEFRRSCVRHKWPPLDGEVVTDPMIDPLKVKAQLDAHSIAIQQVNQKKLSERQEPEIRSDDLSPNENQASVSDVSKNNETVTENNLAEVKSAPPSAVARKAVPSSLSIPKKSTQTPRPHSAPRPTSASAKSAEPSTKSSRTKTPSGGTRNSGPATTATESCVSSNSRRPSEAKSNKSSPENGGQVPSSPAKRDVRTLKAKQGGIPRPSSAKQLSTK